MGLKPSPNPNLLVGFDKADDAGVYLLNSELALIQTVDFFTPIVDDPFSYGQIAAANALGDVYAMGGKPLTAMNILCYPEELGSETMSQILAGGLKKTEEAGCTLVGGHSVRDAEMKYGLSVTGVIHPGKIFSNDRAQPGQVLVLTKKLGTGIVTTAAKFEDCPSPLLEETIRQMATLNDKACEAMVRTGATSCTDITGFGFLGHLSEMTRASGVSVRIHSQKLPVLKELEPLVADGYITRGDKSNREYAGSVEFQEVPPFLQHVLYDPQTSGGLLISMPAADFENFQSYMRKHGQDAWLVGEVLKPHAGGAIKVS